jgi:hypothetical protein
MHARLRSVSVIFLSVFLPVCLCRKAVVGLPRMLLLARGCLWPPPPPYDQDT